jgi:hypothetical protein
MPPGPSVPGFGRHHHEGNGTLTKFDLAYVRKVLAEHKYRGMVAAAALALFGGLASAGTGTGAGPAATVPAAQHPTQSTTRSTTQPGTRSATAPSGQPATPPAYQLPTAPSDQPPATSTSTAPSRPATKPLPKPAAKPAAKHRIKVSGDTALMPRGAPGNQASLRLDARQRANADRIIAAGDGMKLSPRAQVIAVATALQESHLTNFGDLGGANDHDSLGLFQQRPSSGWGSPAELTDPDYAARAFYKGLESVPGYERMPLTEAAQTVQVSAYPDAYAKWERLAAGLVKGYHAERAGDARSVHR